MSGDLVLIGDILREAGRFDEAAASYAGAVAAIAQAAFGAKILSWVGFNYRWPPLVQFARKLISDGSLGWLTHYRGRFLVDYGSDPSGVLSWRFQRELAGWGTLGDLMSHVVDSAMKPKAWLEDQRHTREGPSSPFRRLQASSRAGTGPK